MPGKVKHERRCRIHGRKQEAGRKHKPEENKLTVQIITRQRAQSEQIHSQFTAYCSDCIRNSSLLGFALFASTRHVGLKARDTAVVLETGPDLGWEQRSTDCVVWGKVFTERLVGNPRADAVP